MSAIVKVLSFAEIRSGDGVTIRTAQGQTWAGIVQPLLYTPAQHAAGTVVLNMGGRFGAPAVCTPENFVGARRRAA